MADGEWHTVRSHAEKQQKQQKKKAQKAEEQAEEDDGPIMIDAPRIASANQWQAFEEAVEAKRKAAAENERRNKLNREQQKAQAAARAEAIQDAPKQLAAAQLILFFNDPSHMTQWIEEARTRYADSVEGQLRLIASHLEEPFENVREKERGLLLSSPLTKLDLPYTSIPRVSRVLLEEVVENSPSSATVNLFWFLFEQLYKFKPTAEVSGIGLKMMIQCIARRVAHIPALVHSMRANIKPFIHNNKFVDRTVYDIVLWLFGQIASADAPSGLTLWYEYLLPVVLDGGPQASDALDFIDFLFAKQLGQLQSRPADPAVAVQSISRILGHLGGPSPNPRLQAIFPLLQKVSVLLDRSSPRVFFATILAHAGHKNSAFRPLVLELLFSSLEQDSGAFETWRQYYTRFIVQSNNLIYHIFGAWDARPHSVNKKELARVLRSFISMNKQILDESYKQDPKHEKLKFDHKEVRVALASSQALLQRIEGNVMASVVTIGVLLVAIGGGLVYNTCVRNNCSAELCYTLLTSYCTK